jgi:hypothetical protein
MPASEMERNGNPIAGPEAFDIATGLHDHAAELVSRHTR